MQTPRSERIIAAAEPAECAEPIDPVNAAAFDAMFRGTKEALEDLTIRKETNR